MDEKSHAGVGKIPSAPTLDNTRNLSVPQDIWNPLPASEWDADTARHLLRRAGWSAQPTAVERAVAEGMGVTLDRLFPAPGRAVPFPRPSLMDKLVEETPRFAGKLKEASPEQKRALQKEARERTQQAENQMCVEWLQFASQPEVSAQEKWTLFLGDVYVVSFEKVRNPRLLYQHQALLRDHGLGKAPALAKEVSRSPAMMRYLDLQTSRKDAPNENFARELFELFILGEGNYTEQDIKQAARAFTGYQIRDGKFFFNPRQHDGGPKTVFGQRGNFTGDDVIDLAFRQPAASRFIPQEMVRFYLSEEALPKEHLETLASWWAAQKWDLRALALRFFGSRLFYDSQYRGNYIKSPIQYYLGLMQDLELDVVPIPRQVLTPLRQMGQVPFLYPNVRGWVGGRSWINSATLSARRQLVQNLFNPVKEANLNADDQLAIADARAAGHGRFTVDRTKLQIYNKLAPERIADIFLKTFYPDGIPASYRDDVIAFLKGDSSPGQRFERIRNTAIALLQAPEYQLC